MSKKDQEPNQNLSKLVSKVKVLSNTVDELEKEVEALKSKICRKKDKRPTTPPNESKIVANPTPKASRFRLKFFRKSEKTKENGTPDNSGKKTEAKKNDDSTRDVISRNNSPSDRQSSSGKNYAANPNAVESKRKSDFTQTSNHSTQISRQRSQKQVQVNYSKSDSCCCKPSRNLSNKDLKKLKKDKDKIKSKRKMCSDDCPYLTGQSHCNDSAEKMTSKSFKNKKLMVNLIGSNRDFKDRMRKNKNFVLDCEFLQKADFAKLIDPKDERCKRKIKLFGKGCGESSGCSGKDCKSCAKNCKTKNVLKIKKAILTQEPPMIFISPELEKCKMRWGKKKHKNKCKNSVDDAEICCDDCCPSMDDERAANSNCYECPCSSFAASMNARYNKLCQT